MKTAVFIKNGNILYIAGPDCRQAPDEVFAVLHQKLTYTHREFLYGAKSRDRATGKRKRVEVTDRRLYGTDQLGRLYTNFGFMKACGELLTAAGYSIKYLDMATIDKTPRARPRCYQHELGNVSRYFQYRPTQLECLNAVIANECGLVHAITGYGKRIMIVMICLAFPYAKIDIVIRSVALVNQMVDELSRYLPNIGQVGGGKKQKGDRITVYTRDSLAHSDFDADILIGDESHELITEEAAPMLARYTKSRNYALTASPIGRMDGTDIRLEGLFGPTIFYIPYWQGVELNLVVPIRVEWSDVILDVNPAAGYDDPVERKRAGIWFNNKRNNIIAAGVNSVDKNSQFMVLTETIHHAVEVFKRIDKSRQRRVELIYDTVKQNRFEGYKLRGDLPSDLKVMTPELKEKYRREFEAGEIDVVATKTWEVGIDPVNLEYLFVAGAFSSEIKAVQAPGRASRISKSGDKDVGIIRDYADQFDESFHRAGKTRHRVYASMRWEQVGFNVPNDS